jgi:hypothetical protein
MNITNLDGDSVSWSLTGHISKARIQSKSSYHLQARSLISSVHPTLQILEEVGIPVRKGQTLYMDFYLPLIKTCIEVHGEQHYRFVSHYHGNIMSFLKSQQKDKDKKEWCSINNIRYIELPHNENIAQWTERLAHEQ